MIDLRIGVADPATYGWKAHYLSRVAEEGLNVPNAIALSPMDGVDSVRIDEHKSYAVRSSGLAEDSEDQSFAGHFRTYLEVRGATEVRKAIAGVRASAGGDMPMGVIVQEMVASPRASGVVLSVDPVSLATASATVNWVYGLGDGLVGGDVVGNDLKVTLDDATVIDGYWPHGSVLLQALVDSVRRLQNLLRRPVDVEWAVSEDGELAILQVRPVVLPGAEVVDLDSSGSIASLPGSLRGHPKLELRAVAAARGIRMSPARAVIANAATGVPEISPFAASEHSAGRSVVLVHPTHVGGRIVREFTKDCGTDVEFFVRGCQRYAIRQYPEQSGAAQAVIETLSRGLEHAAFACVIEQEILHAYATGILRKTTSGYLVEVALGHFVPKGYVETTAYALSDQLDLVAQAGRPQSKAYHFINGHVVTEVPPFEVLAVTTGDLRRTVEALRPILLEHPGAAVEFGLLGEPGELDPYLIDIAESDHADAELSLDDLTRGVVSRGLAQGPIIDLRDSAASDDLNGHLYDTVLEGEGAKLAPAVYVASIASVDLLPIVRAAHPDSGFIFERASTLAHLAVVLRERGIAAVILPAEEINSFVERALPVRIRTAERLVVMPLERPVSE